MVWWLSYLVALLLGVLWAMSLLIFCTVLVNKEKLHRNFWLVGALVSKIFLMVAFVYFVVVFGGNDVASSLLIFGFASALVLAIWLKRIFVSTDLTNLKKI